MKKVQDNTFSSLGLQSEIMQAIEQMGYKEMTEIQRKALPVLLVGGEVVAKAPTGTGKTCAFGIPIVQETDPEGKTVTSLVLAPTRELALQISDDLRALAAFKPGVKVVTVYGGDPIDRQVKALKNNPQILVATPGRLIDLFKHRHVRLDTVRRVVLDECDKMLDMGFFKDVRYLIEKTPKERNLNMFSATISREVMDMSWLYQKNPQELTVERTEESKPKIRQYIIESVGAQKTKDCVRLIKARGFERVIIFTNTKRMADMLAARLKERGLAAECLHGDMRQQARTKVMNDFKAGKLPVLVATDVAARGIDVDDVDAVINYDIPDETPHYLHRIGRTGRAGKEGESFTFYYGEDDAPKLRELERITGTKAVHMRFTSDGTPEEFTPEETVRTTMRAPSPPRLRRNR
ncbi:MAG TPA: DEAD/DEAH box helicase [Candidatus Acidoferrum sp.]|nr:DEAD/DEAH box helicase [Candidatus Acidoferrum sp.]